MRSNTCFTAQRPHRYSLAMSLVICMAWSRQNRGLNKTKKQGKKKQLCLACVNTILGSSQKTKTNKNPTWHTVGHNSSDSSDERKRNTLNTLRLKTTDLCNNTTHSKLHLLLKTVWFSFLLCEVFICLLLQ